MAYGFHNLSESMTKTIMKHREAYNNGKLARVGRLVNIANEALEKQLVANRYTNRLGNLTSSYYICIYYEGNLVYSYIEDVPPGVDNKPWRKKFTGNEAANSKVRHSTTGVPRRKNTYTIVVGVAMPYADVVGMTTGVPLTEVAVNAIMTSRGYGKITRTISRVNDFNY